MKDRRFWLAVVSACMATQHNTGEAAVAVVPDAGREYSVRVHTSAAEEEAVVSLFDDYRYEEAIETANAAWPRLEAMPDRVLYCVAECYIRTGQVRLAKTSFELLNAHSPQNHRYRAGLAYTLLYAGQLDRGIAMYRQVLLENQGMLAGAAEDAAALLSMGNIGGGKALFQLVIDNSTDKQHYSQLYEKSLRMYRLADDVPAVQAPSAAVAQTAVSAENEQKLLHTQAVEMAQNGQYQQSLDIMARLVKADVQDKSILFDYVTILQQAGQNEQAINVYNQQSGTSMPFSVIKSVSTAYYQLQEYDKALAVLQPAITCGERDALLWAGEMNLRCGNASAAQSYYERLLSLNPNDYEVYFSRGMLSLQTKDYKQASRDLERARRLLPECQDKAERQTKLEHNLAIAYMNSGQDQKAASILVNHTKTLPVKGPLASDYIIALGNSSQYELAVREGERLWTTYTDVPIPGLRSLAESYLRLGKQGEALAVYRYLAELQPNDNASRRMLAFQLMLNGRTAEGLSYYDQLLGKAPASADAVIADAVTLINTDKYIDGKSLFELVLSKYPNPAYRRQYAEVLVKKNHNRAAYKQYQLLSAQPEGELDGLSGMARTASALGDYSKSRQALDTITSKYGRSKAVTALGPKTSADRQDNQGIEPRVLGAATSQASPAYAIAEFKNPTGLGNSGATAVKGNTEISKDAFAYEMAQLAANFLAAPVTSTENFKIEFAFAVSTITAKAMPLIPSEQRNDFTYEMAQVTSNVINDQNLEIKKAKIQFAQLTTKVVNRIDKTTADKKITTLRKNDDIESQTLASSNKTIGNHPKASASGGVDPTTYNRLMDDLMQVGDSSKHQDNKINIDGEIRVHFAANSGSTQWDKDASGLRLYLGADTRINKNWQLFGMLEGRKSIKNYDNKLELSRLYAEGKVGESTVKAGKFGYLMAEGNIYDSSFTGIKVDFGDPIKYSLSCGETEDTKATYIATARYKDFNYNLETGVYHYRLDDGSKKTNTIWNIGGNYHFSNFSIGAMYLGSSLKDRKGNSDGYVLSLTYGDLRTYRPGTYSMFAKYYNQPQGTYIDHGMNGKGNAMQGIKGYGAGVSYAVAKDLVAGVEYYDLADKVTGEKGKTIWAQLTHYF